MTGARATGAVADGAIGSRWTAVRRLLLALAVACAVAAIALQPAVAARYLSSDGNLAPSSRRALHLADAVLVVLAGGMLLVWHRWRTATPRRERIVIGVAAVTGSLLISGLATEAGLTVIHRFVKPLGAERHYFFQYDPVLGWKHRPGSLATFKNSLVRIDGDGLRVPAGKPAPARSRVLLLGDSQAFGDGVAAEDTFAARLETDISGLRVLNASVIGYGTDQQLLYFEQEGLRFTPDVTVVALNAYDLRDNLSTRVRSGYAKPRFVTTEAGLTLTNVPVPGDGPVGRLNRELQHHSHLYRLLSRMRRGTARQGRDEEEAAPGQRLEREIYPDDAHIERGLAVTAAILDRLARSAGQDGGRLVVLFLPYQMDFAGGTYADHTERLVTFLQQRAADGRFTFLDGRSGLAGGPPESMFLDAMHLSPEGHQRIATMLERTFTAENLISRTYEH